MHSEQITMETSRHSQRQSDMEDLLFYDIEITEYDALVVFMSIDKEEVAHFWNTRGRTVSEEPSGFEKVPDLIRGKTLVGYNNYNYDDYMLTFMMDSLLSLPKYLKAFNNTIISGHDTGRKISPLIRSLDTMQQIDVSHPSLKQVEGNMGISIVESSIPFDINRPLTDEERDEMLHYCRHDVMATVDIYKLRKKSYFDVKKGLVAMLPDSYPENSYRWNTTTISANILLGNGKLTPWLKHRVPEELWKNVEGIPTEVWDMWADIMTDENVTGKGKSKTIKDFGCNIVFGMGGLHAAPKGPRRYGRCKHKDVASMYPSSIVRLSALGDATEIYDDMRQERIRIKKSDPIKAGALKLVLNSVYGNFKNQYSSLNNPMASATVCVYGQIALFSLCKELSKAGYKIVNGNTDGVVYLEDPDLGDMDEVVCSEWERRFRGYTLDTDYYTQWIQKDVNNYIALGENGEVTVKGGDVNKYQTDKFFSNNSARIVQIALVEHLLYKKNIFDVFAEHINEPILWQFVLKAGSTFKGVQNDIGEWQNKVNRVFAAAEGQPYTKLYKVRKDDGLVNFPDVPERMYLWNQSVDDLDNFEDIVDQGYYYGLVYEKLKGWLTDVH